VVPAPIRQAVAQKNARDMAQVASLSREVEAAPARSGIDGGTHRRFAARFADRQIRVGSSEQTFSLASQSSTPVTLVSARSAVQPEAPAQPQAAAAAAPAAPAATQATTPAQLERSVATTVASAPVPQPSPLRTTITARSDGAPAQASAFAPAPAPAEQAPSGNWLTRMIGTRLGGGTAEAPTTPQPAAEQAQAPVPTPRR
jgi:pilus assembly protein FimV